MATGSIFDFPTTGGSWKFEESFKCDKLTYHDKLIERYNKTHSIVLNKYVKINPGDIVRYFDSTISSDSISSKFGDTKIHLWYNPQFPLVNVCRYEDNEISSTDSSVLATWSVAKFAYPILGFSGTDKTKKILSIGDLNSDSVSKLREMGNGEETFTISWAECLNNTTTTSQWLDYVKKWISIHNNSISDDKTKNDKDFMLNLSDNFVKIRFNSIFHKLTENKIDDLSSLFFTI